MIIWLTIISVVLFAFGVLILLVMGCLGRHVIEIKELKQFKINAQTNIGDLLPLCAKIDSSFETLLQHDEVTMERLSALEGKLKPFQETVN